MTFGIESDCYLVFLSLYYESFVSRPTLCKLTFHHGNVYEADMSVS